ncbi:response regulator [Psychrobacillus antarcticus]|uniref:response regulator n=1 Tax=Psychrobacillus antarcticus TaxID=2879115 RepID=UPI00240837E5|nr:response regulator [Psychrobacillus antarcticus]
MKVVIIDDERAMHLIMKRMLGKIPDVEIVGYFQDTSTAFSFLMDQDVDVIFLDISMPKESGLEFAERFRKSGKHTKLIFVTSHKEYALSAFDVYAFDYIIKPVNQERLQNTMQRVLSENIQKKLVGEQENVIVKCLGGIDIESKQSGTVKWKSSKSAELFGYLLLNERRRVARSRLTEDIFGGMPQKNAETYLNTTVYQLRKLLKENGLKGSLYSDKTHYVLKIDNANIDFLRFEEGYKKVSIIDETNIEFALELEQLYRGDLFGEFVFLWALGEVERFTIMYITLVQRLCRALLTKNEITNAIRLLTKLLTIDELNENSSMLLMKALALQNNSKAINQHYKEFTERLHREIGISPSHTHTSLYKQLLTETNT